MPKFEDLTGRTFNRLYVVKRVEDLISLSGNHKTRYLCRCSCPAHKEVIVQASHLKDGHVQSCGCLNSELSSKRLAERDRNRAKHGKYKSGIYTSYRSMVDRCLGRYHTDTYGKYYVSKGITICPEWRNPNSTDTIDVDGFREFYNWSISHGYEDGKTIDRIDGNKGYSPDNCRWATPAEQQNNLSTNRYINCFGQDMTVGQAANVFGIDYDIFRRMLRQNNYDPNCLIGYVQTPYGPIQTVSVTNQPQPVNAIYFLDEYGRPVNQNDYKGPTMIPILWNCDDKGFFTTPVID